MNFLFHMLKVHNYQLLNSLSILSLTAKEGTVCFWSKSIRSAIKSAFLMPLLSRYLVIWQEIKHAVLTQCISAHYNLVREIHWIRNKDMSGTF